MKNETKTVTPTPLVHYTVNTGHTNDSPRSAVGEDIIQMLSPVVRAGRSPIPRFEDYQLWVTESPGAVVFTIMRINGEPLILCGLAWTTKGAQALWPDLKEIYDNAYASVHDQPEASMPTRLPWLSVVLFPGCARVNPEHMYMMGDLERCIAWTILENQFIQSAHNFEAKLLP